MQCVVLAAGEGKRMRPLTAKRPKVMLPLANRPMMEHLVLAARDAGISEFIFVVGYGEREIRGHFGDGTNFNIRVTYAPQRHQNGTADAVRSVREFVSRPFLLLNGDMILKKTDIADFCKSRSPCMGISATDHPGDYGVVLVEGDKVTSLEEKSRHPKSNLINAGAYLFSPDIFDMVDKVSPSARGELELTDALSELIAERKLGAFQLSYWMDVGYPWDMLDANATLMDRIITKTAGTVEEGVTISGTVLIGEGSIVKAGTYIEGPCIIGRNCRIGPHAYIRGATSIGNDCHIGHCSEVKNSVILTGTKIPHFNYVGDSIIGSSCNLGAGTKIANLRNDRTPVKACGRSTGRVKFGAIVGDGVSFGINCSVNAGSVVGSNCRFAPQSYIHGCIMDGTEMR